MGVGVYNFTILQGATLSLTFIYKDSDGDPVNLGGYTARMQMRASKESATALINATTANGKLSIVANQGKVILTLTAADTDVLNVYNGVYDLELVDAGGSVTRLLEGEIVVNKQVTR